MTGTLTIDAGTVRSLASRPAVVAAFPFLRGTPSRRSCCRSAATVFPSPESVMRALVSLPPERRQTFKNLVGASTVTGTVVRAARVRKESF